MRTRFFTIIMIGIIIASGSAYLYDQMYDCLNPPMWIKHPRHYGLDDCLQMYYNRTLPDYTQARENYAQEQAHREKMIEIFSEIPEVVVFYAKYDDANVSVRDDHVSYFAGKEKGSQPRMNLYYDTNDEFTHMRFYCFYDGSVQNEVAQEDIMHYLKSSECGTKNSLSSTIDEHDTLLTRTVMQGISQGTICARSCTV